MPDDISNNPKSCSSVKLPRWPETEPLSLHHHHHHRNNTVNKLHHHLLHRRNIRIILTILHLHVIEMRT